MVGFEGSELPLETRRAGRVRAVPVAPGLTKSPTKARAYSVDPYFREGWETLGECVGSIEQRRRFAWSKVPVCLRPDAIAAGRGDVLLARLADEGLRPVAAREVRFDRWLVREVWRYQLNVATPERIAMMDLILVGRPGLLVLFDGGAEMPETPRCVALRAVKGPSAPSRRTPSQLRATLSEGRASVFTLIHTPDEPIDVVRDLAVFLDEGQVRDLVTAGESATDADGVLRMLAALRERVGAHDLSLRTATAALGETACVRGRDERLPEYVARLASLGSTSPWDALVAGAHAAATHYEGWDPSVPDTSVDDWAR